MYRSTLHVDGRIMFQYFHGYQMHWSKSMLLVIGMISYCTIRTSLFFVDRFLANGSLPRSFVLYPSKRLSYPITIVSYFGGIFFTPNFIPCHDHKPCTPFSSLDPWSDWPKLFRRWVLRFPPFEKNMFWEGDSIFSLTRCITTPLTHFASL